MVMWCIISERYGVYETTTSHKPQAAHTVQQRGTGSTVIRTIHNFSSNGVIKRVEGKRITNKYI